MTGRPGTRRVAVVTSNEVPVPVTLGFLRPLVVVPSAWTSWPAPIRGNVMVHETAHVDRFDWPVQLFARAVCALYWFNPLVWLAAKRLYVEAEQACDERVLESGSSAADYAEQLLLLSRGNGDAERCPLVVAIAHPSDLLTRIKSIHRIQRGAPSMSRYSRLTIALLIILAGTLIGSAELTAAQSQPPHAIEAAPSAAGPHSVGTSPELTTPLAATPGVPAALSEAAQAVAGRREDPLLTAASRGNAAEVSTLLANGADPNLNIPPGGTPLIRSASGGHADVVELLLAAGADPNLFRAKDEVWRGREQEMMRTALTEAARRGHLGIVGQLLDAGANVNAVPAGDPSALMEAAENGHEQIFRLLVERGADVDRAIPGDGTPLIAAARGGNLAMVRLLVQNGADVNRPSPGDGNALIAAVRRGDRDMVRLLVEAGADPFRVVPGDESAVIHAAERGDEELLRLLLDGRR